MRYYISTIYIIGWLGGTWVVLIIARHVSRHYRPPFTLCYIILTKDASNNFRSISPPHLFFSSTNHFHIVTYSPCPALGEWASCPRWCCTTTATTWSTIPKYIIPYILRKAHFMQRWQPRVMKFWPGKHHRRGRRHWHASSRTEHLVDARAHDTHWITNMLVVIRG